jgi:hypothetical protein
MKKIVLLLLMAQVAVAQQESLRMVYPFIPLGINPAEAGQRGVASITGIYRKKPLFQQNLGGSSQQYFSFDMPIANGNGGFGFLAYNTDQSYRLPSGGIAANLGLSSVGAYALEWGRGHVLRFGGQLGVDQFPILDKSGTAVLKGSFGFGLMYTHDQLTIGLSKPSVQVQAPTYLRATYVKQLDNLFLTKVGSVLRVQPDGVKVDAHATIWWNEKIGLGIWYQGTGSEFGDTALLVSSEVALGRNFRVGYAYDLLGKQLAITAQTSSAVASGFHQIFLRYEIDAGNGKIAEFRP